MSEPRVPLAGSAPNAGAQPLEWSTVDPDETASVTVTLRRRRESAAAAMEKQLLAGQGPTLTREQAEQLVSADPRDISAVRAFLEGQGLTITEENAGARTLKAKGTVKQMEQAFSTQIGWVEDSAGHRHLSYRGSLSIPESLDGVIASVIGLDQRPIARPR